MMFNFWYVNDSKIPCSKYPDGVLEQMTITTCVMLCLFTVTIFGASQKHNINIAVAIKQ